jgi:thymidylate kinase
VTEQALLGMLRGRFIALEGPDGSGKSTCCKFVVSCLCHVALVCKVREPGGTPNDVDFNGDIAPGRRDVEAAGQSWAAGRAREISSDEHLLRSAI